MLRRPVSKQTVALTRSAEGYIDLSSSEEHKIALKVLSVQTWRKLSDGVALFQTVKGTIFPDRKHWGCGMLVLWAAAPPDTANTAVKYITVTHLAALQNDCNMGKCQKMMLVSSSYLQNNNEHSLMGGRKGKVNYQVWKHIMHTAEL